MDPESKDEWSTREEHCSFKKLNHNGKCIAKCRHNRMLDGFYVDCIGICSQTVEQYCNAVNELRKLH